MNRRTLLKQVAITGAAAMFLQGCFSDPKKVSIALENLKIDGTDEDLLATIAETLIPATDKPGAREVGAHHYTLIMVDDGMSDEDREKYVRGLKAFKGREFDGDTFINLAPEQRINALKKSQSEAKSGKDDLAFFINTTRQHIIHGYTTSQYFLTEVRDFKLVPGPVYKGCVPLDQTL